MKKVTMNLTDTDLENLDKLFVELNARSKAGAVSTSLGIAKALMDAKHKGSRIIIQNDKGESQELIIPGAA